MAMLSTADNPFNPFTQFDEWNSWDESHGYFTNAYLGRIARTSNNLSPKEYEDEINRAINEILEYNLTGNYIKVEPETA